MGFGTSSAGRCTGWGGHTPTQARAARRHAAGTPVGKQGSAASLEQLAGRRGPQQPPQQPWLWMSLELWLPAPQQLQHPLRRCRRRLLGKQPQPPELQQPPEPQQPLPEPQQPQQEDEGAGAGAEAGHGAGPWAEPLEKPLAEAALCWEDMVALSSSGRIWKTRSLLHAYRPFHPNS